MISTKPDYLPKAPPPDANALGGRGGLQQVNSGRDTIQLGANMDEDG